IDLATTIDVTLLDTKAQKIPTGRSGLTATRGGAFGALVIGRSSSGLAGLVVLSGVIDTDYTGEVFMCAYTLTPPLTICKGTRIAQLVLIDYLNGGYEIPGMPCLPDHGNRGFGSTGEQAVSLVQQMNRRPMVQLQLTHNNHHHHFTAMLDTGVDVTIIS
ncbi:POK9 protein, partial [Origma solitaria]|nr:POK9 protein [Origma solitaria]